MKLDEFVAGGKHFVWQLLQGICVDRDAITVAAWPNENRVTFAAKVSREDDQRIRYSDDGIYSALKVVIAAAASTHKDPDGHEFRATFKLYDPDMGRAVFDVPSPHPF